MLSDNVLKELYGGLPRRITVNVEGPSWGLRSPAIFVKEGDDLPFFVQGGVNSEHRQLSHIVRRLVGRSENPEFPIHSEHPVICVSQCGAADVERSAGFYEGDVLSRLSLRDVEVLDAFGVERVVAYGSSIGALAAIALAAQHSERVAAVIAVNPAGLILQDPWEMLGKAVEASLQVVERDSGLPPIPSLSGQQLAEVVLGQTKNIAASDVGLGLLDKVQCPVLIYTGRQDEVFPWGELVGLEDRFQNVQVAVMEGFTHIDPVDLSQANRVITEANKRLREREIISEKRGAI